MAYVTPSTNSIDGATTASAWNVIVGDVIDHESRIVNIVTDTNNLIVPPAVSAFRSSNLTGYTSNTAITFQDQNYDTNNIWTPSAPTVFLIATTGLYHAHFQGQFTCTGSASMVVPEIKRSSVNIMSQFCPVLSGTESRFSLSGVVSLTAADSLTATITTIGSISALIISGSATYGEAQTRLSLTWIGRTS